jgi:hypothetical protein
MATLFVDKVDPQSGTSLEIGSSGDTITIPSGCTITNNGTQSGFGGANTPAFEAFLSSDQTISNNTNTKIQFNTEVYDTASAYDNSSNYRFTPQTAGKYFVYSKIRVQSTNNTNLKTTAIYLYKNGSNICESFDLYWNSYIRSAYIALSTTVDMNGSSDYLELYGYGLANDSSLYGVMGNSDRVSNFGAYKIIE